MRKSMVILGLLLLPAIAAMAQEKDEGFDVFYGPRDLKGGAAGYNYLFNADGFIGTFELYYLTQSKKSAQAKYWPLYYGVSLEGAWGDGNNYRLDHEEVEFNSWWIFLWIDGKIFYQDREKVRPYIDVGAGLGTGQFTAKGLDEDHEVEINWRQLELGQVRLGTGIEFMLDDQYALDLGVEAIGMIGLSGGVLEATDMVLGGAQAKIGISKWSEKKK